MRALILGALVAVLTANAALAGMVCSNLNAVRQIAKLQNLEMDDEMTTDPSPASPQRKAIIRGLVSRYCSAVDSEPDIDYREKLDVLCTLYSGVASGSRVYWVGCLSCQEAGVGCE